MSWAAGNPSQQHTFTVTMLPVSGNTGCAPFLEMLTIGFCVPYPNFSVDPHNGCRSCAHCQAVCPQVVWKEHLASTAVCRVDKNLASKLGNNTTLAEVGACSTIVCIL